MTVAEGNAHDQSLPTPLAPGLDLPSCSDGRSCSSRSQWFWDSAAHSRASWGKSPKRCRSLGSLRRSSSSGSSPRLAAWSRTHATGGSADIFTTNQIKRDLGLSGGRWPGFFQGCGLILPRHQDNQWLSSQARLNPIPPQRSARQNLKPDSGVIVHPSIFNASNRRPISRRC